MKRPEKNQLPLTHEEEKVLLKTGRRVFSTAFPNPDGKGCPTPEILKDLVYRSERFTLKEREHWFDHASNCSPCFTQISTFRQAFVRKMRVKRSVVAVLAVGILSWLLMKVSWRPAEPEIVTQPPVLPTLPGRPPPPTKLLWQQASLDRRYESLLRGEAPKAGSKTFSLPRTRLRLTVYLPIGSEEGQYEVQLLDKAEKSLAFVAAKAQIRKSVGTILELKLDTSGLEPGKYQLGIRQKGWQWRFFPIVLN